MHKNTKQVLITFLLITFGLMYGSHGIIAILLNQGVDFDSQPIQWLGILGGAAPALGALFIVAKFYSKEDAKDYWRNVYRFKVSAIWWAFVFLAPLLTGFIANLVVHRSLDFLNIGIRDLLAFPIIFAVMIFAGGAEELGWRGIMQKRMYKAVSLPLTGVIIGIIWGVWHLPLFLIEGFAHYDYHFLTYVFMTILFSLFMTGLVFKTSSVGLAILFHASINAFGNLGFGIPMLLNGWLLVVIAILIGLSVIWLLDMENKVKNKKR